MKQIFFDSIWRVTPTLKLVKSNIDVSRETVFKKQQIITAFVKRKRSYSVKIEL